MIDANTKAMMDDGKAVDSNVKAMFETLRRAHLDDLAPYERLDVESGAGSSPRQGQATPPRPAKPLFNQTGPYAEIKHENYRHRMVAYLTIQGMRGQEIANRLGYSNGAISNIQRQPWFRELVLEEMTTIGRDCTQEMLRGQTAASVLTLIEIRDDVLAPKAVRARCASDILDRVYGKSIQPIAHMDKFNPDVNDPESAARAIESEISRRVEEDPSLKKMFTVERSAG